MIADSQTYSVIVPFFLQDSTDFSTCSSILKLFYKSAVMTLSVLLEPRYTTEFLVLTKLPVEVVSTESSTEALSTTFGMHSSSTSKDAVHYLSTLTQTAVYYGGSVLFLCLCGFIVFSDEFIGLVGDCNLFFTILPCQLYGDACLF